MEPRPSQSTDIRAMKLRELTELSEAGAEYLLERFTIEIEDAPWADDDKQLVYRALEDAQRIHVGDTIGNRPVIVHPLRVALRILSQDHFNVRDRPDLVIAALLHDTVEDHPERWIPELEGVEIDLTTLSQAAIYNLQQRALDNIAERYRKPGEESNQFGERIRAIVQWLTSEPYRDDLHEDTDDPVEKQLRKWDVYEAGVRNLLQAEDAFGAKVIKLSDFIENFIGGMKHHEHTPMRIRLARKYVFLSNDMATFVERSTIIPEASKKRIKSQIASGQRDALQMITSHVRLHPADARLYDMSHITVDRLDGRHKVRKPRLLGLGVLNLFNGRN